LKNANPVKAGDAKPWVYGSGLTATRIARFPTYSGKTAWCTPGSFVAIKEK